MSEIFDADYLFSLARDKSAEGRNHLAEVISDLFDEQGGTLSDRERTLMFNIIRGLIHDVEAAVRRNFSARLATLDDVPGELINELANDEIAVAYPVLTGSKVLRDAELIDVIRIRTHEHQLAVTLRTDISEDVSAALVETHNENVILSLLENENASISQSTMAYLVQQSERLDTFQEPILKRNELNESLAKKMFMWVSAALRKHIVDRYEIDPQTVEELLEEAARQGYDDSMANRSRNGEKLAEALDDVDMITPNMVVAALADGESALFLDLFSAITRLNQTLASRILFEAGGEGLAIACRAVDFTERQFIFVFEKTRRARPGERYSIYKNDKDRKLIDLYRKMEKFAAERVLKRWQRGSDFLAAIRELDI